MDARLNDILAAIEASHADLIEAGARHYLEVSIAKQATKLGYADLARKYKHTHVVVPLRQPQPGMKVRIDGRTFVSYAQFPSGLAAPDHLARETDAPYTPFMAQHSMICNFA